MTLSIEPIDQENADSDEQAPKNRRQRQIIFPEQEIAENRDEEGIGNFNQSRQRRILSLNRKTYEQLRQDGHQDADDQQRAKRA